MLNQIFLSYTFILTIFSGIMFIWGVGTDFNKQNSALLIWSGVLFFSWAVYVPLLIIIGLNHIWGWGL